MAPEPANRHREFLLFVLKLIEAIVDSAQRQQFLMRTLLAQASFVEHENAMRVLNRAQPVRDDDRGAAFEQAVERLADQQFGLGVHTGSGFVENQELRVVRQRARETDELPLADGKRRAALGNRRLDSLRQVGDERTESDFA